MLPRSPGIDTLIIGAGLAGACAALHLSQSRSVLLLEASQPAAGASGVAAGLVNPLMGQQAKAVWRTNAALHALQATLDSSCATALLSRNGILRPAKDRRQAGVFQDVASARPHEATWLRTEEVQEQFPNVAAPWGALLVRRGGALSVPAFIKALLTTAVQQGTQVITGAEVTGWKENSEGVHVDVRYDDTPVRMEANRVILALGYGYQHHTVLSQLNLHAIKGQTVRVAAPTQPPTIPLAGQGYIVPEGDTLVVGSSYERSFSDLHPSDDQTRRILTKAANMLPALRDAAVLDATAGVRVTVPGTRLPMLGPLPGHQRIWIFTGLGSKGLLMAPLLAQHLASYLEKPDTIPPELRVTPAK